MIALVGKATILSRRGFLFSNCPPRLAASNEGVIMERNGLFEANVVHMMCTQIIGETYHEGLQQTALNPTYFVVGTGDPDVVKYLSFVRENIPMVLEGYVEDKYLVEVVVSELYTADPSCDRVTKHRIGWCEVTSSGVIFRQ